MEHPRSVVRHPQESQETFVYTQLKEQQSMQLNVGSRVPAAMPEARELIPGLPSMYHTFIVCRYRYYPATPKYQT
eukprot:1136594-Pelagomonas_calceolata.AAC.1